jgi:hypothetical protein
MLKIELTLSDGTELSASYNGTFDSAFNFFFNKETNEKRDEHIVRMTISNLKE